MVHNKVYQNIGLSTSLDFQEKVHEGPDYIRKITRDWFDT